MFSSNHKIKLQKKIIIDYYSINNFASGLQKKMEKYAEYVRVIES